jgi:hypothetical protein
MPNYVYERWQGSLISFGFLLIAITFNTVLARRLPMVANLFVFCHVFGIVILIPLLVLSPKRHGGSPLVEFYNPNGWASNGLATLVGVSSPLTAVIGFDCSVHMCMSISKLLASFTDGFTKQLRRLKIPLSLYQSVYLLDMLLILYLDFLPF